MPPRIANWPRASTWSRSFVAGVDELLGGQLQIHLLALANGEAVRPQLCGGDGFGEGDGAGDDDGVLLPSRERVERGDPQPDQMRRRRDLRRVARAARGVMTDAARAEVGVELAGQVAGRDVVGDDDQDRAAAEGVAVGDQRGGQEGAKRG